MMDTDLASQVLKNSKFIGNLRNHPLAGQLGLNGRRDFSGFMKSDPGKSEPSGTITPASPDFQAMVALAQAQAEMASSGGRVDQEAARNLVQMRALAIQNEMFQSLSPLEAKGQEGQSFGLDALAGLEAGLNTAPGSGGIYGQAMDLVAQTNGEAALSSANLGAGQGQVITAQELKGAGARQLAALGPNFRGNLLGHPAARTQANEGRTFSREEMNSWRQKNGFLRATPPPTEATRASAKAADAAPGENLKMPYGRIVPPRRAASERGWSLRNEAQAAQKSPEAKSQAQASAQNSSPIPAEVKAESADKSKFSRDDLSKLVDKVGQALNLDPALIMAVIKTESNFDHQAVSRVGAKGLMQLMPGTASDLGVSDPFNPVENVWGGARYLKQMLERHGGNIDRALASYNWGPGNFDRYSRKGGKMPTETRNYIARVNQHYTTFKQDNA